jgi:hypothetical protein
MIGISQIRRNLKNFKDILDTIAHRAGIAGDPIAG